MCEWPNQVPRVQRGKTRKLTKILIQVFNNLQSCQAFCVQRSTLKEVLLFGWITSVHTFYELLAFKRGTIGTIRFGIRRKLMELVYKGRER